MEIILKSDENVKQLRLPAGFTTRPARMEDAEMVVEMCNVCSKELLGVEKHRLSDTLAEWSLPNIQLDQTAILVFAPDGNLAGYGEWWDINEPYVRKGLWYRVRPEFNGLDIDKFLVNWAEDKARQAVGRAPDEARVTLQGDCSILDKHMQEVFKDQGFAHIRTGLRMVIDLIEPPSAPQWPAGFQIQSLVRGKDEKRLIRAVFDSFSDHWGFVPEPFEAYKARWEHFMDHKPDLDPTLWFMALEGEAVAGMSLCYKKSLDDPEMGWVGTLGVCRPWRRRGLGLALLQHSFCELYQCGLRKVGLGVDADSLTGATRLYEKAGMRSDPLHTHLFYEKELRPGIELSTQHVD
jgi:mycothiol synthase